MKTCQEIMTKDPVCCLPDDKVDTVAQKMQSENVGALPVVESYKTKKLLGMVTDRDLTMNVIGESRDGNSTSVRDVMTSNPVSCYSTDSIDKAVEAMATHQIRRMPVVDTLGQVVGIISQADIATRLDSTTKVGQMVGQISVPD